MPTLSQNKNHSNFSAEEIIIAEEHIFISESLPEKKISPDFRLILGEKEDDAVGIFRPYQTSSESILTGAILQPSYADEGKCRRAFHKACRDFEKSNNTDERIHIFIHLRTVAEKYDWAQNKLHKLIFNAAHQDKNQQVNTALIWQFNEAFTHWIAQDNCDLILISKTLLKLLKPEYKDVENELFQTAKRIHIKSPLETQFSQFTLAKYLTKIFTHFLNSDLVDAGLPNYWMEQALKHLIENHTRELEEQIIEMIISHHTPSELFNSLLSQLGKEAYFDTAIDFLFVAIKAKCVNEKNPNPNYLALVGYYELQIYAHHHLFCGTKTQKLITDSFKSSHWKLHPLPKTSQKNSELSKNITLNLEELTLDESDHFLTILSDRKKQSRWIFKTATGHTKQLQKQLIKHLKNGKKINLNHFELLGKAAVLLVV